MGTVSEVLSDLQFKEFIEALLKGGWIQVIFPFLLVYVITFTALREVNILGDKKDGHS